MANNSTKLPWQLYRLDANGPHLITTFSGPLTRTETLPARTVPGRRTVPARCSGRVLMVAPCPHPYDPLAPDDRTNFWADDANWTSTGAWNIDALAMAARLTGNRAYLEIARRGLEINRRSRGDWYIRSDP